MLPLYAELMLNGVRMHRGELREANDRFEALVAVHDPDQMRRIQEAHGVNYMVHARAWQSHALWCLGYPEAALSQCRGAVQLARDLAQPFNQALAATYVATLMQLCAGDATVKAHAEEALALATEHKARYYQAWSTILVDFARAWEQPDAEHITRLRDSITAFIATRARLRLPYYLSLLARVCGKAGRGEEGLTVLDEALAAAHARNERWWDAELYHLRGELLLAYGARERDAEAALLRAIEIARAQQARSLELRAATSLARLWSSQQRADEGRRLLADLHGWFTEGLDTPDLRAARSLLAQLA
jgi:predicted ATPase